MRVILVERLLSGEQSRLNELQALVETLNYEVVAKLQQVRNPDPAYQIGKGKAKELAELVKTTKAERVVFRNQLTPSQAHKLSRLLGVEVVDRFQIVLEIFAMRAGSPEAKLQIEYARLKYELPKIREQIKALLSVEQPGFRGGGEYEVNVRYDMVKRKLATLRRKLKSIEKTREERRKFRRKRGFKLVALAGYTNSGKSTLLNALTDAKAEVDNMYFTTLMPRTRALKASKMILLTDTVGFIDDLPPWLFEAFKATLEEIYLADLVVLLVDASDPVPEIIRKLRTSQKILAEYSVKTITALNKIDLITEEDLERKMEVLHSMTSTLVPISATQGTNLDALLESIRANT
ncbi:MAG: GTPase HflX [Candidatus Hadarchaeum sp.]|uniref:GTPase HflX n=1 Tax=Candidatus Hadarchaeum sp. TaxID=2883567 RepID=UPI0031802D95